MGWAVAILLIGVRYQASGELGREVVSGFPRRPAGCYSTVGLVVGSGVGIPGGFWGRIFP